VVAETKDNTVQGRGRIVVNETPNILRELKEIQGQFFDKAYNYARLVLGLGYGGFFAAWSGSKQYLLPSSVIRSVLLVTCSLLLFILFEIFQTFILSIINLRFSRFAHASKGVDTAALERFRNSSFFLTKLLGRVWVVVFPVTAITGLLGVGILIWGFVHSLLRRSIP
jgi:hypothetical protein